MALLVNVPDVPGVPDVQFAPGAGLGIPLLTQDTFASPLPEQWGIFNMAGAPVVVADTVAAVEYRGESVVSDFPLERGAFESFDKVRVPYDARVRFIAGGTSVAREALLSSIAAIAGDLNTYSVVTREAVYPSANIVRQSYVRSNSGLLQVDVMLQEVRIASSGPAGPSNTASPSDAAQVDGGTVQPVDPLAAANAANLQHPPNANNLGFGGIPSKGFANAPALT